MLTEVASSIIAASLPISHGPKLSPRSQFRSMVVMVSCPVDERMIHSVWRRRLGRHGSLPRLYVECIDCGAGDVCALQRIEIEYGGMRVVDPVRQRAQQFGELPCLGLRLAHADGFEPKCAAGRRLCQPAEIG